jgi:hypothetical protein
MVATTAVPVKTWFVGGDRRNDARGRQMHTPHAWSSVTHSSVGGLMDPAFLRQAIGDADVPPWTAISSLGPARSRWGTAIDFIAAGLSAWMSAHRGQH